MNSNAAGYVVAASMAAGGVGPLILWRRRRQIRRNGRITQFVIAADGTFLCVVSIGLFGKAFGWENAAFAVVATILASEWVALIRAAVSLPAPAGLLSIRAGETKLLRKRWTGVPFFGAILRRTPLRHLGGPVYLDTCSHNVQRVIEGMHDAEAVHIYSAGLCIAFELFWAARGSGLSAGLSLGVNLILNIYPVLHLRLACGRLERLRKASTHKAAVRRTKL
jgi:hypothetical protein